MLYRCYQDGKRCSEYGFKGWEIDTFPTKREAEVYCALWAYPIDKDTAELSAISMEVGVPTDMSMGEYPVMMETREVME